MAIAPLLVGKIADHYDLITALHIPILAQLAGAAFFLIVIVCIQRNGLRHPVLARHWIDGGSAEFTPAVALRSQPLAELE
jgi:hypothetical protein